MKKTKIVCTIGPKTESVELLSELLEAGMNVMRMNFSHGNHEEHKNRIVNLKEAIKNTGINAAVLLDTKGPEIRTIKLIDGKDVALVAGQKFVITTDETIIGDENRVAVTYKGLTEDLKPGNIVLIDDGLIEMEVEEIFGNEVRCLVKNNGDLGENKGVNLPNVSVQLPALSAKDMGDLKFGCKENVDFVAASFIRKADDVKAVREVLDANGGEKIKIISKIENQEGLDNFDEILELSDGIMVARGDLGVEIPVEEVPFAQKMMVEKCNLAGKVVITATQMLDSMIKNPRPTRAEATDVTNAILDGTDAIMLSGETAKGKYPVEAVTVMRKIAEKTDPLVAFQIENEEGVRITEAMARGTVDVAEALGAKLIVVGTSSGRSAMALRRYFPEAFILAITNNEKTYNQMILTRGVIPYLATTAYTLEEFYAFAETKAVELGLSHSKDVIVAACGEEVFKAGTSNSMKVIKVK
ncbi:pyruvate kinase PykF [uncultured Cetobacterium sp.]|uniref:pyruvate kinase PykF n=1 Tax=uncultured Cetobacterium sp. TaxID=527638 RepID=UPI0026115C57|nr:pyruvate kinase PykF [uncultured Cetobacterium sp.]